MSPQGTGGGYTGISLAGRWECGRCGASGDGWYTPEDGLEIHDENDVAFNHDCEDV